jgi:dimethylsulfoniopropionate demethylase
LMDGQRQVGTVTSAAYSPDYETNVAIGMVRMTHWEPKTDVDVVTQAGVFPAVVQETFWI